MRRRTFLAGSAALLAKPGIVRAQLAKPTKRLAMVRPAGPISAMTPNGYAYYKVFFEELARLGYVEGQNLMVFRFSAEGHQDRYKAVVQQAIDAAPDVIWSANTALRPITTTTIPFVVLTDDPIANGFATNLAHPTGNITGVTIDGGLEIWGKRLSILKEAVEKLNKPRFLCGRVSWEAPGGRAVRQAADQLGLSLSPALLNADVTAESYTPVFDEMKMSGADGLIVSSNTENITYRQVITALAAQHRLPAIYPYREFIVDGGLLAYGIDLSEPLRLAAGQIASIFGGTKIADIPFVQPTKYQLIANVKAAQAIGLTLPSSLLLRADEVIE
jgi:putative tryptophan/tyrosine transport system substrate-binding protein